MPRGSIKIRPIKLKHMLLLMVTVLLISETVLDHICLSWQGYTRLLSHKSVYLVPLLVIRLRKECLVIWSRQLVQQSRDYLY